LDFSILLPVQVVVDQLQACLTTNYMVQYFQSKKV